MAASLKEVIVDCTDPGVVAAFWAGALGREVRDYPGGVRFVAPVEGEAGPLLVFVPERRPKESRNRLRLALGDAAGDMEGESARLVALGARRLPGGGGGAVPFAVLADPEGNEFCVLGTASGPPAEG